MYQKFINGFDRREDEDSFGHCLPIKSVEKKLIKEFETSIIPELGEIIYLEEENKSFQVVKKIRILNNFDEAYFILEVSIYTGIHNYSIGTSARIPLVIDIEDKNT